MFQSIDELVDENDHRWASELDGEESEAQSRNYTLEYLELFSAQRCMFHILHRQNRTLRGYNLLVKHVPGFEKNLVDLDISELGVFFRDVWQHSSRKIVLIWLV